MTSVPRQQHVLANRPTTTDKRNPVGQSAPVRPSARPSQETQTPPLFVARSAGPAWLHVCITPAPYTDAHTQYQETRAYADDGPYSAGPGY